MEIYHFVLFLYNKVIFFIKQNSWQIIFWFWIIQKHLCRPRGCGVMIFWNKIPWLPIFLITVFPTWADKQTRMLQKQTRMLQIWGQNFQIWGQICKRGHGYWYSRISSVELGATFLRSQIFLKKKNYIWHFFRFAFLSQS